MTAEEFAIQLERLIAQARDGGLSDEVIIVGLGAWSRSSMGVPARPDAHHAGMIEAARRAEFDFYQRGRLLGSERFIPTSADVIRVPSRTARLL
jgi:hypothetical protein